jgi:pimeloyl-ACP methyl ester carboxylesterase
MDNFRKYGNAPYKVVLVHGGPGAAGEMRPVARRLEPVFGVIEPLQTCRTINSQVEEMKNTICTQADVPVILVGFSWGAWLSLLTASLYPALVSKLILIGCSPLDQKYAELIFQTRLGRLTKSEQKRLLFLISELEANVPRKNTGTFKEMGNLFLLADTFEPVESADTSINFNSEIYRSVWNEAAELRASGQLIQSLRQIKCPVIAIHGIYDPHPFSGVTEPISGIVQDFRIHILQQCGHKPWIEKHARNNFFGILCQELSG